MKSFFSVMLLLMITRPSFGMYFIVEPNSKSCVGQNKEESKYFRIWWELTGEEEKKSIAKVLDPEGKELRNEKRRRTVTYSGNARKTGLYSLCVENLSKRYQLTVTFEFNQEKNENEVVSVKNIDSLNNALTNMNGKLERINFNIKSSAVRRVKHSEITNNIQSKITLYTTIKIIFIILFSVVQIYLLTSIFDKIKVVKNIKVGKKSEMSNLKGKKDLTNDEFL